jgi:hypothetical protein
MNTADTPSSDDAGLQRESSSRQKKIVGRPWPKGVSGNPSGRRHGSVSLTAALARTLTKKDAEAICLKLISLAKSGDVPALRLLFDRLDTVEIEQRIIQLEAAVNPKQTSQR